MTNETTYFYANHLASLYSKIGTQLLFQKQTDKAEIYLMKSFQLAQPELVNPKNIKSGDYLLNKISIVINLSFLF
jgi:hypothetical protein